MNTTELNIDEILFISDEDLGAVAGGFRTSADGGGGFRAVPGAARGRVLGGNFNNQVGTGVAGFIIAAGIGILLSL